MSKTNVHLLRDILSEIGSKELIDVTEANEFLDAIEQELQTKTLECESLEEQNEALKDSNDNPDYDNSNFLGLDTIHWSLEKGNLRVMQQVEGFIERMKQQYNVSLAG